VRLPDLLHADLAGNSHHVRCLHIDYLIVSIACDNFVTSFHLQLIFLGLSRLFNSIRAGNTYGGLVNNRREVRLLIRLRQMALLPSRTKLALLASKPLAIPRFDKVEVILDLPATRADFEQEVCESTSILPIGHIGEVAERAVDYRHVYLGTQITCRNASKRSTVDADLAPYSNLRHEVLVNALNVGQELGWLRSSFGAPILLVVPCEHVDAFVEEEL
jgi:hypothetical protein